MKKKNLTQVLLALVLVFSIACSPLSALAYDEVAEPVIAQELITPNENTQTQEPEVEVPEAQEPDGEKPETQKPETQEPEVQEPEVQEPVVEEPGIGETDPEEDADLADSAAIPMLLGAEPAQPIISGIFILDSETGGYMAIGSLIDAINLIDSDPDRYGTTIYINGTDIRNCLENWNDSSKEILDWTNGTAITITGMNGAGIDTLYLDSSSGYTLTMGGALTLENVTLAASKERSIYANGSHLAVASDVTTSGKITVYGGSDAAVADGATLTLNGGTYLNVYGGGNGAAVTGNVAVTVGGNAAMTGVLYGGGKSADTNGNIALTLESGALIKKSSAPAGVFGGGRDGAVNGSITLKVEDGAVVERNGVYGGGYGGVVNGDVSVSVSGSGVSAAENGNASSIITAGGYQNGSAIAYVTGKTEVVLEEGAVTYARIYGNYCGQGPVDGSVAVSDEVVSTVIISGLVTNKLGPTDREGRHVYGGMGGMKPASQLNGSTYVEVTETGRVLGGVHGGSFGSSGNAAVIAGNVNVVIDGTTRFAYGSGANCAVNGSAFVTVNKNGLVEETLCASTGGTGSVIYGNATLDVYHKSPASVNLYPNGGAIPTIIEGGGPTGSKLMGNATINVHPGAEVYYLYAGDRGEVSGFVNINVKDATVVNLVADLVAGAAEAVQTGPISVKGTGACTFGNIYGNFSKWAGQDLPARRASATVDFTEADVTLYRAWYDIASITLQNAKVEFLAAEGMEDYQSMIQVGNVNVDDGSNLILNRSNMILGSFSGGESGTASLTLPAGKKLIAGGTVSGKTALSIVETDLNPALEAQVYLVAQTAGSDGALTWTDSKSPIRFTLKQNAAVFGTTPDNANLTAEELEQQTGSAAADQKWWLVKEAAPVGPVDPGNPGTSYDYFSVTVKYLEKGTEKVLHSEYNTGDIREGRTYDVSAQADLAIKGYSISSVSGATSGTLRKDLTVTVYYVEDEEIIDKEIPLNPAPPTTDVPGTTPGDTDLPDTDIPMTDLPELPATDGDIVIVDPDVPMGNLPQTGTTRNLAGTMSILAAALSAAALTAGLLLRRKESENG